MKLTNNEIYKLANELTTVIQSLNIYMPAKVNFYIQKNLNILSAAAQEIDKARMEIIQHYGEIKEGQQNYSFSNENLEIANKEFADLLSIDQELDIKILNIEAFGNIELTSIQMQALMFMIED